MPAKIQKLTESGRWKTIRTFECDEWFRERSAAYFTALRETYPNHILLRRIITTR